MILESQQDSNGGDFPVTSPRMCSRMFMPWGSVDSGPFMPQGHHLLKGEDRPSEENQKAPRACRRIWSPHLRKTLSESVSLSYEML